MRILILGGRGMVGRNLLENPTLSKLDLIAPSRNELDLSDLSSTARYMQQCRPDLVIHAAGRVGGIQANINSPVAFLMDNLTMGTNVLIGARQAGVTRLLNLGSSCMYPRNRSGAIPETEVLAGELEPTNEGYALAKIVVARLGQYISREDQALHYKTLIPCNLYGRHDNFDPSRSHLIPSIIHKIHTAMANGEEEVEIWGDGTARREFMYAGDFAEAVAFAVMNFERLPPILNVGIGCDFSVADYYRMVASIAGFGGRFNYNLTKPVGMARKLVDIQILTQLGWKPSADVEDGLRRTYHFYLESVKR